MNFNKKVLKDLPVKKIAQAGAVTFALAGMVSVAAVNSTASAEEVNTTTTAGVFEYMNESRMQISDTNTTIVGLDSETAQWILSLMANVEDYVYVRTAPDAEAEIAGKLRKGDLARVEQLTSDGQWYQITSGNLAGYVKADMCVTGQQAKELSEQVGYNGSTGITVAEEQAAIEAARKAAEEAAKKEAAKKASLGTSQKAAYNASCDEVTLLAAIVEKEDGSDGYEGQLAVASAIMNRVRSSNYPNTIEAVVDQKGQFTGGVAGLAKIIARGPSATSRRAAEAALAGTDTVDGMTNFRGAHTGHAGTKVGAHVFF